MDKSYNRQREALPSSEPPLRVAITGGTAGLGLALVREFRSRGAEVAFVARGEERLQRVARELPGSHGIAGDLARKDDIHPIALQVTGSLGGVDVLVNNASSLGPVPLALLADTECEQLELALATNLVGPFRLSELASDGVRVLTLDPGDMDTALHAAALPDADPATLKRPETAARELADAIAAALPNRDLCGVRRGSDPGRVG